MKKVIPLLVYVFSIPFTNAGVLINTLVETSAGQQEISSLQVGDRVICFNDKLEPEEKSIEGINDKDYDHFIEITTEDDVVIQVSPDQALFVPYKWLQASQLSLSDVLLKQDRTFIRIKEISHKQQFATFRFIEVEQNHNFLATQNRILVHNGAGGATAGCWIGRFLVQAVGYTAVAVVSLPALAAGPIAYTVAVGSLAGTVAPIIESASMVGAVAGGIIGGAATGPV